MGKYRCWLAEEGDSKFMLHGFPEHLHAEFFKNLSLRLLSKLRAFAAANRTQNRTLSVVAHER